MKTGPLRLRRLGRTTTVLLLALPAILVTAHTFYWQWMRRALEDGLHAWMSRRMAAGWRIEAGLHAIGGWPLAVKLTVPGVGATAPDRSRWAVESVVLQVSLLHPDRLLIDAPGAQRVTLAKGEITFDAERLHLELPMAVTDAPAEFSLAAREISLSPPVASPLGPSIASISAAGRISHVATLPEAAITALARQWRDRGGSIDVRQFALHWGPLEIAGNATLALDGRLQPTGNATAGISGFAEAIDRLADAGSVPPQAAMLATAALSMLAGDEGTAEVPLELRAGRLSMRQIPLLAVPDLAWPR
jgi:hypothetical protein